MAPVDEVVADGQDRQRLHALFRRDAVEPRRFHVERQESEAAQQGDEFRIRVIEEVGREDTPDVHRSRGGRDPRQQPPARGGTQVVAAEADAIHRGIGRGTRRQHQVAELHVVQQGAAGADPHQPAHAVFADELGGIEHR